MRQDVGSRDGVLNREIDPDATDGRHRMGRVTDTEQTRAIPLAQVIDQHRQEPDLFPVSNLLRAVLQKWRDRKDVVPEGIDAAAFDLFEHALANHEGALPVFVAIQHHQDLAGNKSAEHLTRVVWPARDAEPKHVDGRAQTIDLQPSAFTHRRTAAVSTHRQSRVHFYFARWRLGLHARHRIALDDEVNDFRPHQQLKLWVLPRLLSKEIEKVPLWHEAEKLAVGRQMCEVCQRNKLIANLAADLSDFLVRSFEKLIEQAEFIDHFESRRMDRVAAKVAEKIGVLFEHDYIDTCPREQKPEHYTGRSTADNAAAGADDL